MIVGSSLRFLKYFLIGWVSGLTRNLSPTNLSSLPHERSFQTALKNKLWLTPHFWSFPSRMYSFMSKAEIYLLVGKERYLQLIVGFQVYGFHGLATCVLRKVPGLWLWIVGVMTFLYKDWRFYGVGHFYFRRNYQVLRSRWWCILLGPKNIITKITFST